MQRTDHAYPVVEGPAFKLGLYSTGVLFNEINVTCFNQRFVLTSFAHGPSEPAKWTLHAYCACGYTATEHRCTNCGFKFPTLQVKWSSGSNWAKPIAGPFSSWLGKALETRLAMNHLEASLAALAIEDQLGVVAARLAPGEQARYDSETKQLINLVPAVIEEWSQFGAALLSEQVQA